MVALDPGLGPILVTGGTGQLATSLVNLGGSRIVCVGRPTFDFDNPSSIREVMEKIRPSIVVNAAAWTAVDAAEKEEAGADRANVQGPAELARICAEQGIVLIHVSTDYVYSGEKGAPYVESDPVDPVTVYGRTKAQGEVLVAEANPRSIVLRTAWVYSAHGKNFVRTMINAGARNPTLKVVGDQHGNPTSSDDLAEAILGIIALIAKTGWQSSYAGVFHACGTGDATWHELAVAALEEASQYGQKMPEVLAIRTEDWPTPARRPQDSRLDNGKLAKVFGVEMPQWRSSVSRTVRTLFFPPAG